MKVIESLQVSQALNFEVLIETLKSGFTKPAQIPRRQVFELDHESDRHDAFALLPAWNDEVIGVKSFTYFPNNSAKGFDSLYSKVILFSRDNGVPLACVDGTSVTYWRTAAVSALASQLLSNPNSTRFVLFGSGNLATYLIQAHLSIRPFEQVTLVARNQDRALSIIASLKDKYPTVQFSVEPRASQNTIAEADVICCATGSPKPLFKGSWLQPGSHVDLLGNHHKTERECDSETIVNSQVFVDSRLNVLSEAGELLIPIAEGKINEKHVIAELSELCKIKHKWSPNSTTVFKSVGTALADLLTAQLVLNRLS
ncbi:Ornithine cyclodeaminase [Pseudoalteromonas luteoviolacea B = ATCC 29581]|nr:Ornithine cyclodeaminase [Pseudoalteromonas luteoviolacea B = ATCC 29581]